MVENIRVTLYDIFGFFVPGAVLLVAAFIALWSIYLPQAPLSSFDVTTWASVLFLLLAYVAGHLAQALGNQVERVSSSAEDRVLAGPSAGALPPSLVEAAKHKASRLVQVDADSISAKWLSRICNTAIAQRADYGDRDVYIYREGFYRGLAVSFLALSLALVGRAAVPGAVLHIAGQIRPVPAYLLLVLAGLSLAASWLMFQRYRRFGDYRVTHAIVSFLTLQEGDDPSRRGPKGQEEQDG